ncbi:TPA: type VI secretion system receptor/chaperone Hcp, partial [Escherichia coli]|nr:type VI secretion system receptor/chaperone Hcp [Escherichia coli]
MAVDMFIKIGDVKGESKDKTHAEEIDVLAWSWGMSQSGSMHMGGGGGAGKVNVQD